MDMQEWGPYKLNTDDDIQNFQIGDLYFWIQRKDDEVWIGHEYHNSHTGHPKKKVNPPENLAWSRWAPRNISDSINIMPAFPDMPLVINSDYPLKVTPGGSIAIFTRIPIWLRISMGQSNSVLTELPTVNLSRTWFGTPLEGELCYWSTTKARRSLENVEAKPYLANCPIQVSNKSEDDLSFEKFCFRVERLKIFRYANELWADKSHLSYHGEEQHSDITMSGELPEGMEKGELLSTPRKPIQKSLATRTFHKIFDDSFIFGR